MQVAPPSLGTVLTYTLAPVAATILGAGIAAIRPPGATVRSYIQHFAAGVVFALVAGELLPDLKHDQPLAAIIGGFVAGVVTMMAVRAIGRRVESRVESRVETVGAGADTAGAGAARPTAPPGVSLGLLAAVGIDFVVDGLLIGIGFSAGGGVGRLLVVALTVELLSLGLAVATELRQSGASPRRTIGITAALAALVAVSAVAGTSALRGVSPVALAVVLAFGVSALLFLVTEELLVEAHEVPETRVTTSMFFLGFLVLFVAELMQ